jgi:hypothetical protein
MSRTRHDTITSYTTSWDAVICDLAGNAPDLASSSFRRGKLSLSQTTDALC